MSLAGRGAGARGGSEPGAADDRVAFVLRLGRALHAYGTPSHRLEEVLGLVALRLGLEAQFFSQPTSIFAAFGEGEGQRTYLMRVEPGDVQLDKLVALDRIANQLLTGSLAAREGVARIAEVEAAPPRYGFAATLAAYALSAAAAARFLGGGIAEMALGCGAGLGVGVLDLGLGRGRGRRVFEPLAACLAAALVAGASRAVGGCSVSIATLAGIVALLPGLALATAMTELSSRHLASGTARLSGALVLLVTLAVGVALGGRLAELALGPAAIAAPHALPLWTEWVALAIAPAALMVLFRAPAAELPWILAAGVLAFYGGRLGARLLGAELGIFAGALTAGIASNLYARLRNRPSPVVLVPALILLVPGSVGFRGLALMLERHVLVGVESAFRMIVMLSALVAGLLIANLLVPARRPGEG